MGPVCWRRGRRRASAARPPGRRTHARPQPAGGTRPTFCASVCSQKAVTQKKCYRYYYKSAAYTLALANSNSTGFSYREHRTENHSLPAGQMRTAPTLTAVTGIQSLSSGSIMVYGNIDHVVSYSDTYGGELPVGNYWYGGYTADAEL